MMERAKSIAQKAGVSKALWIPSIWLFLAGSRTVSMWFQLRMVGNTVDDQLEGSPVDRAVFTLLIVCALVILFQRRRKVAALLRANLPIIIFLAYCSISILWSDFPDVAFKRWIRGVGDVAMVLLVLTEASPATALKAVLARTGFVILPLSILSDIGRGLSGRIYHNGLTTNKNLYGAIAMVLGLAGLWRFLSAQRAHRSRARTRQLIAYGTLSLMTVFCLWMANSATSTGSFIVGCVVLVVTRKWAFGRKPVIVHLMVASLIFLAVYSTIINPGFGVVSSMGKDATLTGRTEVWRTVIPMNPNRWIGAGFESFWLGHRLKTMWDIFVWKPNEAHNGYIEVYLNLGWIGLILLGVMIINGHRKIVRGLSRDPEGGSLRLAYLVVAVVYSLTEAGFRIFNPVWIILLIAIVIVPKARARQDRRQIEPQELHPELAAASWEQSDAYARPVVMKVPDAAPDPPHPLRGCAFSA